MSFLDSIRARLAGTVEISVPEDCGRGLLAPDDPAGVREVHVELAEEEWRRGHLAFREGRSVTLTFRWASFQAVIAEVYPARRLIVVIT